MTRAVVALGANLGDRLGALQAAVDGLAVDADTEVLAVSAVYETAPVGGPEQPDYLNAVVLVETTLEPGALLALGQALELAAGRTRGQRWGPRPLDVDLITYGGLVSADPTLSLPHPRAAERAFVLQPWLDVDVGAHLAGHGSVRDLLEQADSEGVRRLADVRLRLPAAPR